MQIVLLQAAETGALFLIILLCVVSFLIGVFVIRWVLGITKIIAHLKRQTYLQDVQMHILAKMAMKEDLTKEEIQKIKETASTITDSVG